MWIVRNASDDDDLVEREDFDDVLDGLGLAEVELYAADNKFRTFFTLWSYDSNDRFQTGGDSINVGEFEKLWEQVPGIEDIRVIILYFDPQRLFCDQSLTANPQGNRR